MAKGFTGCSMNNNSFRTYAGSTSKQTGSSTWSGLFGNVNLVPTRVDESAVLFTWHSNFDDDFKKVYNIRMYVTSTNPRYIKINESWSIGDSNPFSDTMSPVINKLITSSAKDGYLYRDWVEEGYYVIFAIQYKRYDEYDGWLQYWWSGLTTSNIYSSAPSLSYNSDTGKFSIGKSMTGRRILEFYNTNHSYGYPTSIRDEETLNEMYYTSLVNMEYSNPYQGYYYLNGTVLNRWASGKYTVGVRFNTTKNKSRISNAIDSAISQINSVLDSYGIYFTRKGTSGDISIIVDTEENLYDINPETDDYVYGGTWETNTNSSGEIVSATVRLANDYFDYVPYMPYEGVALEELLQSMGAGHDQSEYPFNTIHTEFNYYNKYTYITSKDRNILNLLYSDYTSPNDDYTKVALSLNIPKGCYMASTSTTNSIRTVSDSFLERGCNYKVRVFIVNSSGNVSYTSNWISVSVPEKIRPDNFSWTYAKTQNGNFNLTATEWNNFTSRINEFREYCGLTAYTFTKAYSGNDFKAAMYNQARSAIRAISGYGSYIPLVSSGDDITAYLMNIIVSELNAIP